MTLLKISIHQTWAGLAWILSLSLKFPSSSIYTESAACDRLSRKMWRHQIHGGNERPLFSSERNNRKNLWDSQRKPWIQIYSDVWQGADGNESRAYLCVYESEKACKNQAWMAVGNGLIKDISDLLFLQKNDTKRKMDLIFAPWFVIMLCAYAAVSKWS